MGAHPRTKTYVARRSTEGKTKREIMRYLNTYIARETYKLLPERLTRKIRGGAWPHFRLTPTPAVLPLTCQPRLILSRETLPDKSLPTATVWPFPVVSKRPQLAP